MGYVVKCLLKVKEDGTYEPQSHCQEFGTIHEWQTELHLCTFQHGRKPYWLVEMDEYASRWPYNIIGGCSCDTLKFWSGLGLDSN